MTVLTSTVCLYHRYVISILCIARCCVIPMAFIAGRTTRNALSLTSESPSSVALTSVMVAGTQCRTGQLAAPINSYSTLWLVLRKRVVSCSYEGVSYFIALSGEATFRFWMLDLMHSGLNDGNDLIQI